MARVEIAVNGRAYAIGCEDGQEERLTRLAQRFDNEVSGLAERVGQIGDLRLFLMAGLVMCDALDEAETTAAKSAAKAGSGGGASGSADSRAAALVTRAAERVEALAARIATA